MSFYTAILIWSVVVERRRMAGRQQRFIRFVIIISPLIQLSVLANLSLAGTPNEMKLGHVNSNFVNSLLTLQDDQAKNGSKCRKHHKCLTFFLLFVFYQAVVNIRTTQQRVCNPWLIPLVGSCWNWIKLKMTVLRGNIPSTVALLEDEHLVQNTILWSRPRLNKRIPEFILKPWMYIYSPPTVTIKNQPSPRNS